MIKPETSVAVQPAGVLGSLYLRQLPSTGKLRALIFTTLFPNSVQPLNGSFVLERMRHLLPAVNMTVVAPVPYFPRINLNQQWFNFATTPHSERFADFEVDHPRYIVFPKVGMTTHGFSMFAGSLLGVWRRLRATNYDLIDAHYVYPDGLAAVLLGAVLKKPVVVSARGSDINVFPQYKLIRPLVEFVLRRADAVIAVSQSLKDAMVDLGCPEKKITVVRNGVDSLKFRPQSRLQAREKLCLPIDRPIVLSVGRLSKNKGFQILIDAIARLRHKHPDVLLVIIGNGSNRSRLEAQVRQFRLQENVRFAGTCAHEQLSEWYSAADLFCLASACEGCPNVVLEALACGCPVIATGAGGTGEVLTSASFGTIVERTPEAFESALEEGMRREWDHRAIAAHGRSHSWEKAASSLLDVYSQVVALRKS